ncbi:SDR family oxidoreductase [Aurantimonas sp. A2-1-M11]|uniref:SDR family oxidoreductase n=1 Tax=Aurantimonas sp. A2-1-M11 TaxID=3113712 RepID=UPI002F93676C
MIGAAEHAKPEGRAPERVIITGASAGVGRAIAEEFARHGWRVGLIARGRAGLEGAADAVRRLGGEPLVLQADVSDPEALDRRAGEAVAAWGGIDVWINVAMVTMISPIANIEPDEYRRVTDVTYHGQVFGTMTALRRMKRQGHGTIVSIGSALSYRGIPLQAPYCGAKFAVRGFLDALRSELDHDGSPIRVTEVHLPAVNTPQFHWARNKMPKRPQPMPPIYQAEAIAREVWRATHEAPRELWLGGSAMQAILGDAAAPGVVDHMLAGKGYSGQQTDEPAEVRRDNLFEPVDDERGHGAHGRFDGQARERLLAFRPERLRVGAALGAGLAAALLALALTSAAKRARPRRDRP